MSQHDSGVATEPDSAINLAISICSYSSTAVASAVQQRPFLSQVGNDVKQGNMKSAVDTWLTGHSALCLEGGRKGSRLLFFKALLVDFCSTLRHSLAHVRLSGVHSIALSQRPAHTQAGSLC